MDMLEGMVDVFVKSRQNLVATLVNAFSDVNDLCQDKDYDDDVYQVSFNNRLDNLIEFVNEGQWGLCNPELTVSVNGDQERQEVSYEIV